MNRIELRGVIVPSTYDVEWMKPYIDKGIIAPESYIRNAIGKADKSKPLSVYINSPGGSVFAAYEIINALVLWRADSKQPVEITIGAMAASAASAIAVLSGAKVSVFRNSKIMFHGAWTVSIGGAELHEDTADLLEKIDADMKARLVSKYGIDAALVDEWFSEGREGWLSASDAFEYGIASEIVDNDDDEIDFDGGDIAEIEQHGMAIAALLETVKPKQEAEGDETPPPEEGTSNDGQPDNINPDQVDQPAETAQAEPAGDEKPAECEQPEPAATVDVESVIAERVEIALGSRTQELVEKLNAALKAVESREKTIREKQSHYDKTVAAHEKAAKEFETRLANMQAALEQANARAGKLLAGSLTFSPEITSWAEALATCGGDYVKARQQHPDVYNQYMQQNNTRKS